MNPDIPSPKYIYDITEPKREEREANESGQKQEFVRRFRRVTHFIFFEFNETSCRSLLCVSSVKERQKVGFQKVIQNELKERERENEKMYFSQANFS